MHLIAALASGIRGAESGYVQLRVRGAGTTVTWYASAEGDSANSSGDDIELDENGGAEVYVNQAVDVTVLASDGTRIRTFTEMAAAPLVECRTPAFNGVNYDDATTGAGSNFPVSLDTILGLWLDSAGTLDFLVLGPAGTATTLQSAFGALRGLYINVKDPAYGALGDGVADDTAAIIAAITAATAAGIPVLVPPGTYRVTDTLTLPAKVSLIGAGPNASVITMDHATNDLLEVAGATTYHYRRVSGLRLTASQPCSGYPITIKASSLVHVDNCYVGGGNCEQTLLLADASAASIYRFDNCTFEIGVLDKQAVVNSGALKRAIFDHCRFIVPSGNYAPGVGAVIYGNHYHCTNCVFDGSAASAGTFAYWLRISATLDEVFTGCTFVATGGATATALALGSYAASSRFFEDNNDFAAGVTAYSYTVPPAVHSSTTSPEVQLRTRDSRATFVTVSATPYEIPLDQYGLVVIDSTVAGNVTFTATRAPAGARSQVAVRNSDGNPRDFVGSGELAVATKTISAGSTNHFDCTSLVAISASNYFTYGRWHA